MANWSKVIRNDVKEWRGKLTFRADVLKEQLIPKSNHNSVKQSLVEPYAPQIDREEMLHLTNSHSVLEENQSFIYSLNKYNDVDKLYRIVAYVLRWSNLEKLKKIVNWFHSVDAMKEARSV